MAPRLINLASKAVAGLKLEIADKEKRLAKIRAESLDLTLELSKARHAIAYYQRLVDHQDEAPVELLKRKHLRFDERAFMNIRERYQHSPSEHLMEQITENFFKPLAEGYWKKESYRFRRLDESTAVRGAIVACFLAFDNFDPGLGTAFNYFCKIAQKYMESESIKECTYYSRFQTENTDDDISGW